MKPFLKQPVTLNQERENSVLLGMLVTLGGVVAGFTAFVLSNSVALLSDFMRVLSNFVASYLAWVTLRKVSHNNQEKFNYGIGKLENLSSLLVGLVMFISFVVIGSKTLFRIEHPVSLKGTEFGFITTTLSLVVNAWLWRKNLQVAKKEHSPVMESQWRLFRVKSFANMCMSLALGAGLLFPEKAWSGMLDVAASLIIAGFMLYSAYGVVTNSVYDLLDRSLEEKVQLLILRELAYFFDDYQNFHGFRSRRSANRVFVEIFLEFDAEKRMGEIQELIDRMKQHIEKSIEGSEVSIVPTALSLA